MMGVFVKTNEKNVNVIWLASDTPDDYNNANNRHDTFLILISPGKPWLKKCIKENKYEASAWP